MRNRVCRLGDADDRLRRRQQAAGEDVLLDPGVGVAGGQHSVVRHGDGLNRDAAAGRHQPVERREVRGPEPVADRLDHLHRHHCVVAARRRRGSRTGRCRPGRTARPRPPVACARRCCSADSVIERTCAPRAAARRHSSPQPVPISSTRLPGPTRAVSSRRSILRRCASGRCGLDAGSVVEQRARVRHRLVEELGEQVVGQVVVLGDVAARLRSAVVLRPRLAYHRERPKSLQRRGNQVVDGFREFGEQARRGRRSSSRPPCRTRRTRSVRSGRPGGPTRSGGGSPWSAASGRRRRRPCRRGTPAAPAGAPRPAGTGGRRSPALQPIRAAPAPRRASGAESIAVATVSGDLDGHSW